MNPLQINFQNIRSLFKFFQPPICMLEQLEQAYSNLHARYRHAIFRSDFADFEQLEMRGDLFESANGMDNYYIPPPSANGSVLPEFAYVTKQPTVKSVAAVAGEPVAALPDPTTQSLKFSVSDTSSCCYRSSTEGC